MIKDNYGPKTWNKILTDIGENPYKAIDVTEDIDDKLILNIIAQTCSELKINLQDAADAFGNYWVNTYAPKIYSAIYEDIKSAKDFILKMDEVHLEMTKELPNATSPRFKYKWLSDKTLQVTYYLIVT